MSRAVTEAHLRQPLQVIIEEVGGIHLVDIPVPLPQQTRQGGRRVCLLRRLRHKHHRRPPLRPVKRDRQEYRWELIMGSPELTL